jgi:hypothetical protein
MPSGFDPAGILFRRVLPGGPMGRDRRDLLDVLRGELEFIERGGYRRAWDWPWIPASVFEDSPTCLSLQTPDRPPKCDHCVLYELVPVLLRGEPRPCHHIPLNQEGETIYTLERQSTPMDVEETLKIWLQLMIYQIQKERAKKPSAGE